MDTYTKNPKECSNDELYEFEALVLESGEVMAHGLLDRIKRAEKLIFIRDEKCIGVGAIKRPFDHYKEQVFDKSGVPDLAQDYLFELGWIYASSSSREKA